MNKAWQTVRFFMVIAIILTSFQSVMAMPIRQNSVVTIDHSMMQMPMDSQTAEETNCESECCEGNTCMDACEEMDGNCGNCVHLSSLLLPNFLINFSSPSAVFLITDRRLPDLPPPPPSKPPV